MLKQTVGRSLVTGELVVFTEQLKPEAERFVAVCGETSAALSHTAQHLATLRRIIYPGRNAGR